MRWRSCARFAGRLLLAASLSLAGGTAWAACGPELAQLQAGLRQDMQPGMLAAQLLKGAVELVEPVLPPLDGFAALPLARDTAGYGAAAWLLERGLLPDSWQAERFDAATWQLMLGRFLAWYDLEPPAGGFSGADLVADLAAVLDLVGEAVRPVAIVAHDDADTVQFVGVLWNWTSYPRLLVKRVPAGSSVAGGPEGLLAGLGNCAVTLDRYALAPVDTAWRLFVGSGESTMYLLATDPARPGLPLPVAQSGVMDYLDFSGMEVAGSLEFSAAFSGQEIGLGAIIGMVTQLRTNISPFAIARYLEVPPLR